MIQMTGVKKQMSGMGAMSRVKEYLEKKNITKYRFYKTTGFANRFLENNSNMGTDRAEIILRHYPDISPEWLLTGRGSMCRNDAKFQAAGEQQTTLSAPKTIQRKVCAEDEEIVAFLKSELKEKDLRIETLVGEAARLKTLLEIEKKEAAKNIQKSGTEDTGDVACAAVG